TSVVPSQNGSATVASFCVSVRSSHREELGICTTASSICRAEDPIGNSPGGIRTSFPPAKLLISTGWFNCLAQAACCCFAWAASNGRSEMRDLSDAEEELLLGDSTKTGFSPLGLVSVLRDGEVSGA